MRDCDLVSSPLYPLYRFTPDGKVYTRYHQKEWRERVIRTNNDHMGYKVISLTDASGKRRFKHLHRVMAEVFIPNPNNLPCVNHKDENVNNNDITNLEWCSYAYNNHYNDHMKRCVKGLLKCAESRRIPVIAISKNGEQQVFKSIMEASLMTGTHDGDICRCLANKRKTAGGYTWQRLDKEEKNEDNT